MVAGRRPSRRCANREAATTHSLARTSEWPLPPLRVCRKTARVIPGPASSSSITTETARGNSRGMIGIIPTGRLHPTTPASRRAMFRIIRTCRRHLSMWDNRSPMGEIIRTSPRVPISPVKRRATCRTIRTGRPLPTPADSRLKAINPGIRRRQTAVETGPTMTGRPVRGQTTRTLSLP